jgi:hypothetical protein
MNVDIPRRLSDAHAAIANEAHRLDLELSTELTPLHATPPAS